MKSAEQFSCVTVTTNMARLLLLILLSIPLLVHGQEDEESLIRKSVYFGGGSYFIDAFQITELRQFMESVEDIRNYEVILFSHTDPIGGQGRTATSSLLFLL